MPRGVPNFIKEYEREKYNLSCYSADYMLQKAKNGLEVQYNEHKKKLNLLSEIIGDYERGDKNGWFIILAVYAFRRLVIKFIWLKLDKWGKSVIIKTERQPIDG